MSYTKQTWANGDVITAEKLNHMEDGIAAVPPFMIVHDIDGALDKTWKEIHDFRAEGGIVVGFLSMNDNLYTSEIGQIAIETSTTPASYVIGISIGEMNTFYKASNPNDYPQLG